MYDTATLAVMAQQNNANAPFTFTARSTRTQNVGGSIFAPDGTTLYSAFNTAATTNPPPPSLASTLLVNDPDQSGHPAGHQAAGEHRGQDGDDSATARRPGGFPIPGMMHLPLGQLYEYPILQPETTQVFLAMDDCNRGVATGMLKMNNLGKGRLTYQRVAASPARRWCTSSRAAWRLPPSRSRWSPGAAAWSARPAPISGPAPGRSRARRST